MLRPVRDKKMAGKSKEQKNTSRRDKLGGGGGVRDRTSTSESS